MRRRPLAHAERRLAGLSIAIGIASAAACGTADDGGSSAVVPGISSGSGGTGGASGSAGVAQAGTSGAGMHGAGASGAPAATGGHAGTAGGGGGKSGASSGGAGAGGGAGSGGAGAGGGAGSGGALPQGGASGSSQSGTGGAAPKPIPTLGATNEVCKLINDKGQLDPTPNQTHTRENLQGTDLGIPVGHDGTLYFFFGDSIGYEAIWQWNESVPDAVGFATDPQAAIAADPSLLCQDLRFLTVPGEGLGHMANPAIQADFAGASMAPPAGHDIGEFIHNPSGTGQFTNLPGTFEVPSGAFSYGGSIYVFYTTVGSPQDLTMKASYLAEWPSPSTTGTPDYQILYAVDERFDGNGQLGGDFVNVAAEVANGYVYLFGTGDYRASPVHLARKALTMLATPGGFERFDAASGTWSPAPSTAAPIIDTPGFGETSVRFFPSIGRWMFLAEDSFQGNRIVARFAEQPEGPWSDAIVVHDMADPVFRSAYCCNATDDCAGPQLFYCDKAGFYGTYLFPDVAVDASGAFTVTYTMSTWAPYDVAIFTGTFDGG